MKRRQEEPEPHPRYDPRQPLLRELVRVRVIPGDVNDGFDLLLTRVPGIGEHVTKDGRIYFVYHVQHEPVDDDGRAMLGAHAYLDAVEVPEPELVNRKRRRKRTLKKPW